jgi:glycosyltransferase involved in cell wall biosynthesis
MSEPEKPPRVGIGMPVYNMADTVKDAVQSLLSQTYGDFELLISDNASSDGTEALCRALAESDRRIRYVRQQVNLGAAGNFRYVFANASPSPYFMWASADDIWNPRFLEVMVAGLEDDDLAASAFSVIRTRGTPGGDYTVSSLEELQARPLLTRLARFILQPDSRGKANLIYSLFRRRALEDAGVSFGSSEYGADMLFVFKVLLYGPVIVSPDPLFAKRHTETASGPGPFAYVWLNLIHCWRYPQVVANARGGPLLVLLTTFLGITKFVRDLAFWSKGIARGAVSRMKRKNASR